MSNEPTSTLNAAGEQATGTQDTMTRAEVQALLKEQIENNGAYKSMQTALNKTNERWGERLSSKESELAALRAAHADLESGFNFLGETVLNALPDQDRARVESALKEKKLDRLEQQIKALAQPRPAAAPVQSDFDDQMKAILIEAQEALEDAAAGHGLDPKTKGLDYGDETETFAKRLKKLNASVKTVRAANEQADVDSVKQRVEAVPTRTDGGAAISSMAGKDLLDLGSDELYRKMQAIASKR